jgi:hypothetical protein
MAVSTLRTKSAEGARRATELAALALLGRTRNAGMAISVKR